MEGTGNREQGNKGQEIGNRCSEEVICEALYIVIMVGNQAGCRNRESGIENRESCIDIAEPISIPYYDQV